MSTERACVVKVDYIGVIHHVLESTEEECIVPFGLNSKRSTAKVGRKTWRRIRCVRLEV